MRLSIKSINLKILLLFFTLMLILSGGLLALSIFLTNSTATTISKNMALNKINEISINNEEGINFLISELNKFKV